MKTIYILNWDGSDKYFGSINALIKELKSFGSEKFFAYSIDGKYQEYKLDAKVLSDLISSYEANNMNTQIKVTRDYCGMPMQYDFFIYQRELVED